MLTEIEGAALSRLRERFRLSDTAKILVGTLSFYDHGSLVQVEDADACACYVAVGDGPVDQATLIRLRGAESTIWRINKKAGLRLSPETITDYLRFYYSHASGPDGPWLVVEYFHEGKGRPVLPVAFKGIKRGRYYLTANLLYANMIWKSDFTIGATGRVIRETQEEVDEINLNLASSHPGFE
jgi:hypothetical protein